MENTYRHENTKAVINRISRVTGHMEALKKMVEEDRDCSDVLIQLSRHSLRHQQYRPHHFTGSYRSLYRRRRKKRK
jgi:hypothetical protein